MPSGPVGTTPNRGQAPRYQPCRLARARPPCRAHRSPRPHSDHRRDLRLSRLHLGAGERSVTSDCPSDCRSSSQTCGAQNAGGIGAFEAVMLVALWHFHKGRPARGLALVLRSRFRPGQPFSSSVDFFPSSAQRSNLSKIPVLHIRKGTLGIGV
jgi:hypothetical protein